jgi:hypothetical protein
VSARVVGISDGETIKVLVCANLLPRVPLLNIAAPEKSQDGNDTQEWNADQVKETV